MIFWATRYSAILVPPSPSSATFSPAVFGGLGVAGYLGYLAQVLFKDSLVFPFALTLVGLGVIGAGLWWQKHEQTLAARLRAPLPRALRELLEARG